MGLGTHALHRLWSSAARRNLLALALDLGVRHFDTAPSYGDGLAERELGRFGRNRRSTLVLTTKFGIPARRLGELPGWNHIAMAARAARRILRAGKRSGESTFREYSARQARSSLEGSLRALATDHVDILFLHEPTLQSLGEPDALARELENLKADGKARYIGLSGHPADCASIARCHPSLAEVLQIQVPASADGLPLEGYIQPAEAAVSFWEFPAQARRPRSDRLHQTLERLQKAAPDGVMLVSTNSAMELRESVTILGKSASASEGSAKPSLA
jgi:diketogulonate reductase-like aldo/keto reductase